MTDKAHHEEAKRVTEFGSSFWVEISSLANKYPNLANLGLGFPNFESPMFLREAAKVAIVDQDMNQYTRAKGHPRLVNALAKFYEPIWKRPIDPMNQILITVGAAESLHSITQAYLNEGDEILLFEPFFDFFYFQSLLARATPIGIPLKPDNDEEAGDANLWKIDFELLSKKVSSKTKMMIVNTPCNPLGKSFSRKELVQLAIFAQKHGLIVVADEVYEHMIYDENKHFRMAALDAYDEYENDSEMERSAIEYCKENTVQIGSAGKTFSLTGWKIGWMIGPPKLVEMAWRSHQFSVYCCCAPLQEALAVAFENPSLVYNYLNDLVSKLTRNRALFLEALGSIGSVGNIGVVRPGGGYFVLVDISNVEDPGFSDEDKIGIQSKDFVFCRWLARVVGVAAVPVVTASF